MAGQFIPPQQASLVQNTQMAQPQISAADAEILKQINANMPVSVEQQSSYTSVPSTYFEKLAKVESGNNPLAKAKTTSASGLYQFIDKTWKDTVKEMGENYKLEDRFNPAISRQVAEYFTEKNRVQLLPVLKREPTDTELYMAHFLGAKTGSQFLKALQENPETKAETLTPAGAKANKSIFYDKAGNPKTVQQVFEYFDRKFMGKPESTPLL